MVEAILRSDVHLAEAHGDLVLLDIAADRYVCLPRAAQALAWEPDGHITFAGPTGHALFDKAGYLGAEIDIDGRLDAPPQRPVRRIEDDGARMTFGDAVKLALAVLDLAIHYRGKTFRQILDHARRGNPHRPLEVNDELRRRVAQFHAAAIWAPVPGKCLARSFLLLTFLRRCGLDARWVIAARTWPFAAHCWLQVDDVVLDDDPERLLVYSPICAV